MAGDLESLEKGGMQTTHERLPMSNNSVSVKTYTHAQVKDAIRHLTKE